MNAYRATRNLCLTALCYGLFVVPFAAMSGEDMVFTLFLFLVVPTAGLIWGEDLQRNGWVRSAVAMLLVASLPGMAVAALFTLFLMVGLGHLPAVIAWLMSAPEPWRDLLAPGVAAGTVLLGIALLRSGRRKTGIAVLWMVGVAIHLYLGALGGAFMFRGAP